LATSGRQICPVQSDDPGVAPWRIEPPRPRPLGTPAIAARGCSDSSPGSMRRGAAIARARACICCTAATACVARQAHPAHSLALTYRWRRKRGGISRLAWVPRVPARSRSPPAQAASPANTEVGEAETGWNPERVFGYPRARDKGRPSEMKGKKMRNRGGERRDGSAPDAPVRAGPAEVRNRKKVA